MKNKGECFRLVSMQFHKNKLRRIIRQYIQGKWCTGLTYIGVYANPTVGAAIVNALYAYDRLHEALHTSLHKVLHGRTLGGNNLPFGTDILHK